MAYYSSTCVVDLRKLPDESGDFPCPRCGALISPDDLSDRVYLIDQVKMEGDLIKEVILRCNLCGMEIHLIGFEL